MRSLVVGLFYYSSPETARGEFIFEKERDFFPNVPTLSDGIIIKLENLSFVAKPGKLYAV